MQIYIRDIEVFKNSLRVLRDLQNRIKNRIDFIFNQLEKKRNEVNQELIISNNLLNVAKANEMHKQSVLAKKTYELTKALQKEATAVASGNPAVIVMATAYVAKKTQEEIKANKEYQKAKKNRLNMERRVELVQKAKYQIDTLYEQTKIKLNSFQSQIINLTQIVIMRLTKGDNLQKDYLSQNNRDIDNIFNEIKYKNIPQSGGSWSGEEGNSKWKPDRDKTPKQPYGNEKSWGEILDNYNIDGIEFKDGEPDFTLVSKGTVTIDDFSTQRDDNFRQADEKLAEIWNNEKRYNKTQWSAEDVKRYRKKNKLSWHERSDIKTLDLVPQEVHGNIPHSGGIAKKKRLKLEENNDR